MKPNTIKNLFWTITTLFSLFFLIDGCMGILQVEEGKEIMRHLGYPTYILIILGMAKVSGALALLQTKYPLLREWAYAGFTFHFIGACLSRAFAGDGLLLVLSPLLFLGFMFLSYYLWKKMGQSQKLAFA